MKSKVGEKVLVTSAPRGITAMERFVGRVVTVLKIDVEMFYFIEEAPVWVWQDKNFTGDIETIDPNVLFKIRKGG